VREADTRAAGVCVCVCVCVLVDDHLAGYFVAPAFGAPWPWRHATLKDRVLHAALKAFAPVMDLWAGYYNDQVRESFALPRQYFFSAGLHRHTVLCNTFFGLEYPRPLPPNYHLVLSLSQSLSHSHSLNHSPLARRWDL